MGGIVEWRRLQSASQPNDHISKRGKDASGLESAHALPTFPHYDYDDESSSPTEVCTGQVKMKEQSNGVPET